MTHYSVLIRLVAVVLLFGMASLSIADDEPQWTSLFNGKDLDGWIVKVRYHPLGENPSNTCLLYTSDAADE